MTKLYNSTPDINLVCEYFKQLQTKLCLQLSELDGGGEFEVDAWQSKNGQGITRIIQHGALFEKGGVNFSYVHGNKLPQAAQDSNINSTKKKLARRPFAATGVSLVLHPQNPFVPCCHMNVRFFISHTDDSSPAEKNNSADHSPNKIPTWWFGGGYDLTPYYGFDEDCKHWHTKAKQVCDAFNNSYYPRFKQWCDRYFYLPHRQEARGIGGLFFDELGGDDISDFTHRFNFVRAVADSFFSAYQPIVTRRRDYAYDESQRIFQAYRRARYVEFNLVYDRGTLFGLQSGGRIESILMSMPPIANWSYNWQPQTDAESKLIDYYLTPRDWV